MKIFLAIIAFITSSFNALVGQINTVLPTHTPDSTSLTTTPIASPTSTPRFFTHSPQPSPPSSISPTLLPSFNTSDYVYPGSQVISSSNANLSLQSSDSSDSIIKWYEDKVNTRFSTRSDSVTNTNGNVNAQISAGNGSQNITISIKKNAGDLNTTIDIKI